MGYLRKLKVQRVAIVGGGQGFLNVLKLCGNTGASKVALYRKVNLRSGNLSVIVFTSSPSFCSPFLLYLAFCMSIRFSFISHSRAAKSLLVFRSPLDVGIKGRNVMLPCYFADGNASRLGFCAVSLSNTDA